MDQNNRIARADYTYTITDSVVCIADNGGETSLASDAEAVITELASTGLDLINLPVICQDTEGAWNELPLVDGKFSGFRFLQTTDRSVAIDRALLRAIADRTEHLGLNEVMDTLEYRSSQARFEGNQFVMDGPSGQHSIYRNASDINQMVEHWREFQYQTDEHHKQATITERDHGALALARGYVTTFRIRKDSYDNDTRRYRLDYHQAAVKSGVPTVFLEPVKHLLTAGYAETEMWAVALIYDHHVSALQRAGDNEEQFHAAFEDLRNDTAVGDRLANSIANEITGADEEWLSKEAAMSAIASMTR
ncbi:MAG: hypothetical protein P8Y67_13130 [Alphaproteobacteria bacterium]